MASARSRLVHQDERLVQLLDPPFHETVRDPGYIPAYPTGIRENGGQYTHSAAWLGHAFAGLGDGDEAWHIFDIINPIRRSDTNAGTRHYAREPYVLAGEAILGLRLDNGRLAIDPCLPRNWGGFEATLSTERGNIEITVEHPDGLGRGNFKLVVDGRARKTRTPISFPGAGKTRKVRVILQSGS